MILPALKTKLAFNYKYVLCTIIQERLWPQCGPDDYIGMRLRLYEREEKGSLLL